MLCVYAICVKMQLEVLDTPHAIGCWTGVSTVQLSTRTWIRGAEMWSWDGLSWLSMEWLLMDLLFEMIKKQQLSSFDCYYDSAASTTENVPADKCPPCSLPCY